MYERIDRGGFLRRLRACDQEGTPAELRQWLRRVLASDDIDVDADDQRLMFTAVADLDAVDGDERLVRLAKDYADALEALGMEAESLRPLEIVRDRHRLADVLTKVLDGRITRTGFLSFVTEQTWASETRQRLGALTETELHQLLRAVNRRDFSALGQLIG